MATKDLGVLMRALGQDCSQTELDMLTKEVDPNKKGSFDFKAFQGLVASKVDSRPLTLALVLVVDICRCVVMISEYVCVW